MPERGRPKRPLALSDSERETLERWARRPSSPQSAALRARIVLACAAGLTNAEVAARLGASPATVGKWRSRFIDGSLDGLLDHPRPGAPRRISATAVEAVILTTLAGAPPDGRRWSTRSMAAATGVSQSSVSRIWRAFGVKPHVADVFRLKNDPAFVERVRREVGLYIKATVAPTTSGAPLTSVGVEPPEPAEKILPEQL